MPPPVPNAVLSVIKGYTPDAQAGVLMLRDLVFKVADGLPETGPLEETLKWGQPSYLPIMKGVGTTLRLAPHKDAAFAIFAHCQTTVIRSYAEAFPQTDRIDGNRAVLFENLDDVVPDRIRHLIHHALTYHLRAQV